jgi:hypothetical protein
VTGNSKHEIPAFADLLAEQVLWQARAVSRRQAKFGTKMLNPKLETNSNVQNTIKTVLLGKYSVQLLRSQTYFLSFIFWICSPC